ncbi:RagB/SusD family nutrient uptake outer membrane protein [Mucilaginibacter sp. L3T2-6]|uniref:RagB/SusD family nutrient uptake outer membrane protein n=1 Tax=Mucilaginibacter sp. L3T2-6 TaxID=3062491 RepID=UPI002674A365|nr:RagB/SusD family nutrient uptake outer membrane protein [Mucilaginibacter sp. L3T2-6]MDO3641400.1 RagB/SusD family nutrient uptake outer membrane protein [Mucilaginibacter sp. L3T2-6]MDV6213839.1 RagB/SusD family nutrient uptake outer membrane protein [Mucilaginibacter sp. L3T2-6]
MKTFIRNISIITIVSGALLTSCKKDFLNTTPLNQASSATTWADPNLSEAFVTELYNGLYEGELNQENLDCQTDNALYNFGKENINEGNISPAATGNVPHTYEWGEMYARIRSANIALEQLAKAPIDKSLVDRLTGEALFMRAYYYNQLLRYYGGVPLVKSSYSASATDFTIARSSYSDCVDFIVGDLDKAAGLLQGKDQPKGRATSDAALALKARVLLYAASDLHDMPTAKAKSSLLSQYAHPELLGYVDGDRAARWKKAQDAAKAVMDLGKYGFKLDLSAPASATDGFNNYQNSYLSRNGGEAEILFARYFANAKDEWGAWYARNNCPNGYHGWTSSEPTQNMVDDYEMMDGTKFDWKNPAEAAAPYQNRDPRFYASILYDGAPWKPRTPDGAGIDPYNEIQMGTYQTGSSSSPVAYFGLDTRNSPLENWNGTRTGYGIRKFMDPNPAIVDNNTRQEVPSPQIRYTEVVFNYIETCLALGQEGEAKIWLNKIRFRSGMPAITDAGDALVERYRNERNVEMMFEEQRFYDARRWMIAPQTLGNKAKIIKITGTLKPGKTVSVYRYNTDNYNYTYTVQELDPGVENRSWNDKVYFPPINRDEMNKNNKLIQNPGY